MSVIELAPIVPPRALQQLARSLIDHSTAIEGRAAADFTNPAGAQALVPPHSVSWQVFKNPVALLVGGIAAVILELAEPRVRAGVWNFSSFRSDPVTRLRRTGLAAMITVFGARENAERMIAGVRGLHSRIEGETETGESFRADDPHLLNWVQATAAFGFLEAYCRYVQPLSRETRDRYYAEGTEAAKLYGADDAPRSEAERTALFLATEPRLARSEVIFDFLKIMREAPILPPPLRFAQRMLVRAAVSLTPPTIRHKLGVDPEGLRVGEHALVAAAGRLADRLVLDANPAVQACKRLGLPADYLYRRRPRLTVN
jgi:uncharacterized protein (DUF2236 family)